MKHYFFMLLFLSSFLIAMEQCQSRSLAYNLLQAAKEGSGAQVEELLIKGVSPLARPSTIAFRHEIPLMVALNFKNEAAWKVLMEHRFEDQAKVRGLNGYTLMHYAAGNHCMEVFIKLKEFRADVNDCKNTAQETPLMRAIDSKSSDNEKKLAIIKALVDAGASPTLGGEDDAFSLARRQPYPMNEKILQLLNERRD